MDIYDAFMLVFTVLLLLASIFAIIYIKKHEQELSDKRYFYFLFALLILLALSISITYLVFKTPAWIFMVIQLLLFVIGICMAGFIIKAKEGKPRQSEWRAYLTDKLKADTDLIAEPTELSRLPDLKKTFGIEGTVLSCAKGADRKDVIAQMLKNNDETTEFFSISKSQACVSFVLSVVACSFGIAIIIAAILMEFLYNRLEAAIITAASGAVTEVVAGTVLWVHKKTAQQLNHYYGALHENERFLSTVNLVGLISKEKQDDIYIEIIRNQLAINKTGAENNEADDSDAGDPTQDSGKDDGKNDGKDTDSSGDSGKDTGKTSKKK